MFKSAKMSTKPGGPGPWFAARLVNTEHQQQPQSRLLGHTYPHTALGQHWQVANQVGPCDVWADCLAFVAQWRANEQLGATLCAYYGRTHGLRWCEAGVGKRQRKQRHCIRDIKAVCVKPKKQYK